jgi:anti-sigma factor RsiW
MNTKRNQLESSDDAVERLLSSYFRQEMPAEFPVLNIEPAAPTRSNRTSWSSQLRNRTVLVLSVVAVVFASIWAISARTMRTPTETGFDGSSAVKRAPFEKK